MNLEIIYLTYKRAGLWKLSCCPTILNTVDKIYITTTLPNYILCGYRLAQASSPKLKSGGSATQKMSDKSNLPSDKHFDSTLTSYDGNFVKCPTPPMLDLL